MLVVVGHLEAPAPVAPVTHEPAECGGRQQAVRKDITAQYRHQRREDVSRVLLASGHRNDHFADRRMTDLVGEHEQDVADDEFHCPLALRL